MKTNPICIGRTVIAIPALVVLGVLLTVVYFFMILFQKDDERQDPQ